MSKMSQLHAQIKDSDYDDSGYDQWVKEQQKKDEEFQMDDMAEKEDDK